MLPEITKRTVTFRELRRSQSSAVEWIQPLVPGLSPPFSLGGPEIDEPIPVRHKPHTFLADGAIETVRCSANIPAEHSEKWQWVLGPGSSQPINNALPGYEALAMLDSGVCKLVVTDCAGYRWNFPISLRKLIETVDLSEEDHGPFVWRLAEVTTTPMLNDQLEPVNGSGKRLGLVIEATAFAASNVVLLDLDLVNGIIQRGKPGVFEFAQPELREATESLPHLLLKQIALMLPQEWQVASLTPLRHTVQAEDEEWDGPVPHYLFHSDANNGNATILRNAGGTTRLRLAIYKTGDLDEASYYLNRSNLGVSSSWHSAFAANAQRDVVPTLFSPGDYDVTRSKWQNREGSARTALALGLPYIYAQPPSMGLTHAFGVAIGYMTGGEEIVQSYGYDALAAVELSAVRATLLEQKMVRDRHSRRLYWQEGDAHRPRLFGPEHALSEKGQILVRMFSSVIESGSPSHLGFDKPVSIGYLPEHFPSYYNDWIGTPTAPWTGWKDHDWQHRIRGYYHSKFLAWFFGDRPSMRDIEEEAAHAQLEFHQALGGRLDKLRVFVSEHPLVGQDYGRAAAHALDAVATSQAFERSDGKTLWLSTFLEALYNAKTESGTSIGNRTSKIINYGDFNGQHAICQTWEHGMLMRGMVGAYVRTFKAGMTEMLFSGVRFLDGTRKPGKPGNYEQVAVSSIDPSGDSYILGNIVGDALVDGPLVLGGPSNDQQVGALGAALLHALLKQEKALARLCCELIYYYYVGKPPPVGNPAKVAFAEVKKRGLYAWDRRAATIGALQQAVNVPDEWWL